MTEIKTISAKSRIAYASEFPRLKTLSALQQAMKLVKDPKKILVIDTERKAGECDDLYPGIEIKLMNYPFDPENFIAILREASGKKDCVIIDGCSEVWGHCLELNEKNSLAKINGLRSWKQITPKWDAFLSAIKHAPFHVITTWQMKDYIVQKDGSITNQGKKVVGRHGNRGLKQNYQIVFEIGESGRAMLRNDDFSLFPDWKEPKVIDEAIAERISSKFKK